MSIEIDEYGNRVKVCPACDGTRVNLVPAYDEDRNEVEPCQLCDSKGLVPYVNGEVNTKMISGVFKPDGRK
jgi:hypothetical protein